MSADNYLRITKFSENRFVVQEGKLSFPNQGDTLHAVFDTSELAEEYCEDYEKNNIVEYGTELADYDPAKYPLTEPSIRGIYESYFSIYELCDDAVMLVYGDMKHFGKYETILCVLPTFSEAYDAADGYIREFNSPHAVFEGQLSHEI